VRIRGRQYTITQWAVDPRYPRGDHTAAQKGPFDPAHDAAVLSLDRPVPGVAPLPLGPAARSGRRARIVGYGVSRHTPGAPFGTLRAAEVVVRGDRACRSALRRADRREAGQYRDASMLCTQDPDGRAPYATACAGDSGGPLLERHGPGWAVAGIVSWTIACGTDGNDPAVFVDVSDARSLLTATAPPWAPAPTGLPHVAGDGAVGSPLTCVAPEWLVAPTNALVHWQGRSSARSGPTYTPVAADAGQKVSCEVRATNPGGTVYVRSAPVTVRRT
jgi:hypothetical protein